MPGGAPAKHLPTQGPAPRGALKNPRPRKKAPVSGALFQCWPALSRRLSETAALAWIMYSLPVNQVPGLDSGYGAGDRVIDVLIAPGLEQIAAAHTFDPGERLLVKRLHDGPAVPVGAIVLTATSSSHASSIKSKLRKKIKPRSPVTPPPAAPSDRGRIPRPPGGCRSRCAHWGHGWYGCPPGRSERGRSGRYGGI